MYKIDTNTKQIVEDVSLYHEWYAAYLYSEMQDRNYLIMSKDKSLLNTAYKMFIDVLYSETGSTESAFNEFDKFVEDNHLVFLDSEYNLEYDGVNHIALNTQTGQEYKVNPIFSYSARF